MAQNSTKTGLNLDNLLKLFGSSWILDSLNVYCITPVCIFAVATNLISYLILRKVKFRKILVFNYIRINVFNSILISLILGTTFFGTYRVFNFTNTHGSFFYTSYFYTYFLSVFYFYSNLMDICTILERISNFSKNASLKKFIRLKYIRVAVFGLMLVINLPMWFIAYPEHREFQLEDGSMYKVYYWGQTEFQKSLAGVIIVYTIYFLRDIVTLLAKIALNVESIRLIRKYFSKISTQAISNTTIIDLKKMEIVETKTYMSKIDRNLTVISIVMCVFSSIENLFYAASYVYVWISYDEVAFNLFFLSHLTLAVKQCLNMFILCLFNSMFRFELKKFF